MRKFLILFCITFTALFSLDKAEERSNFEGLSIIRNPASAPRVIPKDFVPIGAHLTQSTELRLDGYGFYESSEASLFYTIATTTESLLEFYEKALKDKDWKILQKDKKEEGTIVLAESLNKKILTIFIVNKGDTRFVKLMYRRPGISI